MICSKHLADIKLHLTKVNVLVQTNRPTPKGHICNQLMCIICVKWHHTVLMQLKKSKLVWVACCNCHILNHFSYVTINPYVPNMTWCDFDLSALNTTYWTCLASTVFHMCDSFLKPPLSVKTFYPISHVNCWIKLKECFVFMDWVSVFSKSMNNSSFKGKAFVRGEFGTKLLFNLKMLLIIKGWIVKLSKNSCVELACISFANLGASSALWAAAGNKRVMVTLDGAWG